MSKHTPGPRQTKNMLVHFQLVDLAVEHFKKWPCITTINNLRMTLDAAERDIKAGDAAIAKATGEAA